MSMVLRPYQAEDIDKLRRALKVHRSVLYQLPTGGGKTLVGSTILKGVADRGLSAWFMCHREELIEQTSAALERADVDHGFIAAGYPAAYDRPVTLCSVQTLAARIERLLPQLRQPTMILWDEAHHAAAGTWKRLREMFPRALHLGLSATPSRLDGKGLGSIFNALVPGPSMRFLMSEGYLCRYRLLNVPAPPELENVKKRGADFDAKDQAAVMSKPQIVGDAVDHYKRICSGARAVAFCCTIEHSLQTRDAFRKAGIRAEHLDGQTGAERRRNVMAAMQRGDLDVLTQVDLVGEGVDIPSLQAIIILRRTKSLTSHLQWDGRLLRPDYAPGFDLSTKEGRLDAIAAGPKPFGWILDHVGNHLDEDLGRPEDDREWSLDGRATRPGGGGGARSCPQCFGSNPPGAVVCEFCGHQFEITDRTPEQVAGELVEAEIDAETAAAIERQRAMAARRVADANGFMDVFEIALAREVKNPAAFAFGIMQSEAKKQGKPVELLVSDLQYRGALQKFAQLQGYKPGWVDMQMRLHRERKQSAEQAA